MVRYAPSIHKLRKYRPECRARDGMVDPYPHGTDAWLCDMDAKAMEGVLGVMRPATMNLNRQVIRLAKGILKAWEQWVEEVEKEELPQGGKTSTKKSESYPMNISL